MKGFVSIGLLSGLAWYTAGIHAATNAFWLSLFECVIASVFLFCAGAWLASSKA